MELKNLLPTLEATTTQSPISNILTEEEKKEAIDWEIYKLKQQFARKNSDKLFSEEQIMEKIKNQIWIDKINVQQILEDANQRKIWKLEDEEKKENERKQREESYKQMIELHTVNFFFNVIKNYFTNRYGKFIHNDNNKKFIQSVCMFFANDSRFETENGFSLKKGLLVVGSTGIGKTKTFDAIKDNLINPIKIFSMIDISEAVRENGYFDLPPSTILLDDVGSEQEQQNHFGSKINFFKEFIESRYLQNENFNRIIVTTNLGGEEIQNKYGIRVRSRIREMFNIIKINSEDLR